MTERAWKMTMDDRVETDQEGRGHEDPDRKILMFQFVHLLS